MRSWLGFKLFLFLYSPFTLSFVLCICVSWVSSYVFFFLHLVSVISSVMVTCLVHCLWNCDEWWKLAIFKKKEKKESNDDGVSSSTVFFFWYEVIVWTCEACVVWDSCTPFFRNGKFKWEAKSLCLKILVNPFAVCGALMLLHVGLVLSPHWYLYGWCFLANLDSQTKMNGINVLLLLTYNLLAIFCILIVLNCLDELI